MRRKEGALDLGQVPRAEAEELASKVAELEAQVSVGPSDAVAPLRQPVLDVLFARAGPHCLQLTEVQQQYESLFNEYEETRAYYQARPARPRPPRLPPRPPSSR